MTPRVCFPKILILPLLLMLNGCNEDPGCNCPGELTDTETGTAFNGELYVARHHAIRPDGTPDFVDANANNQYDPGEPHGRYFCPQAHAAWVRDAAIASHNALLNSPYGFKSPFFAEKPNTLCINEVNYRGLACGSRIAVHDVNVRDGPEIFVRGIVLHELFHEIQFSYVDSGESQAWGPWLVEGSADYICDKVFWDLDSDSGATQGDAYLPTAQDYIQTTDLSLLEDHTYGGALFWTYITEQFGTRLPEPARGIDFLQRLGARMDGQSPAIIRHLEDTIDDFSQGTTSFEEVFLDFSITNYTHNLKLDALAGQVPDLDRPRRPYPERYSYYDETLAGGNTPYGDVIKTAVAGWNQEVSGSLKRWAAKYFEIDVRSLDLKGCETLGVRAQADPGKKLGWALIGTKAGKVLAINRYVGRTFYAALLSDEATTFDHLAIAVIGLDDASGFKFIFGSGSLGAQITWPTAARVARVGEKDDPQRFQVRLHLDGPSVLTPAGAGPPSVLGVDLSKLQVSLVGTSTHPAPVINSRYVDGEYWLVVQAPTIVDPAEGDLFDVEVCLCSSVAGDCRVMATSQQSAVYGAFSKDQVIVLDRSGSMAWYGGVKWEAAQNAALLAIDAGADSDRMGLVTFWGWANTDLDCEPEATLASALGDLATNRSSLTAAIEGISVGGAEDGWTALGDGLVLAAQELLAGQHTRHADESAILLLSDGLPNRRLFWERDNTGCAHATPVSQDFATAGPYADIKIYTEGFGPDADMRLLTSIAEATGGYAYAVRTEARHCPLSDPLCMEIPNRLAEAFRRAQEDFLGLDRLYYGVFDINASSVVDIPIAVHEKSGGGVQHAVFAFNWSAPAAGVVVELWDPQGNRIDATRPQWAIAQPAPGESQTNVVYHYQGILPTGTWTARAWTTQGQTQLVAMLSGSLLRGVDASLTFSQINDHGSRSEYGACPPVGGKPPYLRGVPVTILVDVNDSMGGVAGLKDVTAVINNYEAASNRLRLYDDGNHDDGSADDGVYGNRFGRTAFYTTDRPEQLETGPEPSPPQSQTGAYSVFVDVSGTNNAGESFERFLARDFSVIEYTAIPPCQDPDVDRDGLPDRWEALYGIDQGAPGHAQADLDADGLDNAREFFLGTDPYDADTDGGGQADGSEFMGGQDPLYDRDDLIPAIIDYGVVREATDILFNRPQAGTNILHFSADPAHTRVHIWRSDKSNPQWTDFVRIATVDLSQKPRGIYYDRGLKSGTAYSYCLVAEGATGTVLSAPTGYFIGTPP